MALSIPLSGFKDVLQTNIEDAVRTFGTLSDQAIAEVKQLIAEIAPLAVAQTERLANGDNTALAEQELKLLAATVEARVASLSLKAIAEQQRIVGNVVSGFVRAAAMVAKAVVVAAVA